MKKILFVFVLSLAMTACKNSEEKVPEMLSEEELAGLPAYRGEFIHTGEAAVLKGSNFIYGVVLDDMSEDLAKQVEKVKVDEYDMVGVLVKGVVSKNPALERGEEGWPEVIAIKQIIQVDKKPAPADIKIQEKTKNDVTD
jgi:hypothetical protein